MIRIVEVGPRDGLQNERLTLQVGAKVALVDLLSGTGVSEIEVSAFVSPRWVPQLADAASVFARIRRVPGLIYSALVPNEQGLDRALAARADKVAIFTAASETFNRKNINATIEESIQRFVPVVRRAKDAGLQLRGYVSTAFWCPYEGRVSPERSIEVLRRLIDLGVDEVSVGDTIGRASPSEVLELLDRLLPHVPSARVAMHFHDTYGRAVANALASWRSGIEAFDSSVGGIGGCPYAPGATGNIATETLVTALRKAGAEVPVDLDRLVVARRFVHELLGRSADPAA